jgi:hypothetical protein
MTATASRLRGYLFGTLDAIGDTGVTATFGDPEVGPSVDMYHAQPDQVVRPATSCATEQFFVVTRGVMAIGTDAYAAGDMRVQRAQAPMEAIVAGPDGCELTIVVVDRRYATVGERA